MHDDPRCTPRKFAEDINLGGFVDTQGSCDTIQRNLDELEKWAESVENNSRDD